MLENHYDFVLQMSLWRNLAGGQGAWTDIITKRFGVTGLVGKTVQNTFVVEISITVSYAF
jgi:hypothetical protein